MKDIVMYSDKYYQDPILVSLYYHRNKKNKKDLFKINDLLEALNNKGINTLQYLLQEHIKIHVLT